MLNHQALSDATIKRVVLLFLSSITCIGGAYVGWPKSHEGALVIVVVGLIVLLINADYSWKVWGPISAFLVLIAVAIYQYFGPTPKDETGIHGWLVPSSRETPQNPCIERGYFTRREKYFITGVLASWISEGVSHATILQIANSTTLSVDIVDNKIAFSGDIFNSDGNIVAHLEKSEFRLVPGEYGYSKRGDDKSKLEIYDRKNNPILEINYANQGAIVVTGVFYGQCGVSVVVNRSEILINTPSIRNIHVSFAKCFPTKYDDSPLIYVGPNHIRGF